MQPEEYPTYEAMKLRGDTPETICFAMRANGHGIGPCIKTLRLLFGFDLMRTKEVFVRTDGFASLEDYHASLVPVLEQVFNEWESSEKKGQK
jgi:hypothetical protein